MNRQHLAIILSLVILSFLFTGMMKTRKMDEVRTEKERLTVSLDYAVNSAAATLCNNYGADNLLMRVSEDFFTAFTLQYGRESDALRLYFPLFIYCDNEGFYAGGVDPVTDGYRFSDINRYVYDAGDFRITFYLNDTFVVETSRYTAYCTKDTFFLASILHLTKYEQNSINMARNIFKASDVDFDLSDYEEYKSAAIVGSIKSVSEEYINGHNRLASSYGISYDFIVPDFYSMDYSEPSFIVCFQGYPATANGICYENFYVRSAKIRKK